MTAEGVNLPTALVGGLPSSLEAAVEAAAELLTAARFALVYGLVDSTVEAQREATLIADLLGGILDTAASTAHGASRAAFERLGLLTASLGEVRGRADLIVFWGCDPDRSSPGFVERYAPARAARVRVAIDVGTALGPEGVVERLVVPAEREVEALLVLRALVRGRRLEPGAADRVGLPLEVLRGLAARLRNSAYGVLIYEADPKPENRDPERAGALSALVRDANRRGRVRLFGVRMPGNPVGAENVLTWQTGFPGALSFGRGYPRYGPGEFTGEASLSRGDVDAALLVGQDRSLRLSPEARETLRRIPTVRLGMTSPPGGERVFIAVAPLEATAGCVFRMDGVALRLKPRTEDATLPGEAKVLASIAAAIQARAPRGAL
jgi:formylmethanofuran dehydrogenase subunit B